MPWQDVNVNASITFDQTSKRYWSPSIFKGVAYYVRSCDIHRQSNRRTIAKKGCLNPRDIPKEPNKVIFLNHFGPMMENKGNTHVLVCVDHATRYVDAWPVPSTASMHYIDYLTKRWKIIITNQARRFVIGNLKRMHQHFSIIYATSSLCTGRKQMVLSKKWLGLSSKSYLNLSRTLSTGILPYKMQYSQWTLRNKPQHSIAHSGWYMDTILSFLVN